MINALTVDLEHWYSNELIRDYLPENKEDQIVDATGPILDILDKHDIKATFFVLGTVAEKCPRLIREIHENGHEIASHFYTHRMLNKLNKDEFEKELRKSINLLESITGERPIGFRAPYFSIDNSNRWVFDVLKKNGFRYDSSIFPFKTMLYGVPEAPTYPYKPSLDDIAKNDPDGDIIEFPISVFKVGTSIPVGGGFYLRVLPFSFLKFAIRRINKKSPAMIYLHPWETYPRTPRIRAPLFWKFVTYHGIDSALAKFENLLKNFRFRPVREVLEV